jgi:beta-lactamase regulating signal transducer with metallopeptidase domain
LWQSTLFAGAAWLLILALRRNRANARYCVWLAASVKFLIPFSLLIGIGNQMEWKVQPVVVPTSVTRAMALMERPLTPDSRIVIPVESDQKADELEELLVFVWACGFAGLSLRWWLRWRRVRDATRGATQLAVRAGIEVRESSAMLEPGVFGIFRPVLLLPEGIRKF